MEFRASLKMVKLGYVLCLLLGAGIAAYLLAGPKPENWMWAVLAIPALLLVFAGIRHMQRRLAKLVVLSDRLRYESGLFAKTTRTMELSKIQDIRVDQTFGQRLLKIGDLSLAALGGASPIVILSIDRPQAVADHILELSRTRKAAS
ncbi:MAG: PH domain-containing protein [Acidobacteriota bacterium]